MLLPQVRFCVSATRKACGQGVGSVWYLWSSKCYPQNYGRLGIRNEFKTTTSKTPHISMVSPVSRSGFPYHISLIKSFRTVSPNSQPTNQPSNQPTKPSSHQATKAIPRCCTYLGYNFNSMGWTRAGSARPFSCNKYSWRPTGVFLSHPNSHWLVTRLVDEFKEGLVQKETPEKQEVSMMIDGIFTSSRPLYFYQARTWKRRPMKILQS